MTEYILTLCNMPSMLIKPPVLKINIVFSVLAISERHYFKQFCFTLENGLYELLKDLFLIAVDSKLCVVTISLLFTDGHLDIFEYQEIQCSNALLLVIIWARTTVKLYIIALNEVLLEAFYKTIANQFIYSIIQCQKEE